METKFVAADAIGVGDSIVRRTLGGVNVPREVLAVRRGAHFLTIKYREPNIPGGVGYAGARRGGLVLVPVIVPFPPCDHQDSASWDESRHAHCCDGCGEPMFP